MQLHNHTPFAFFHWWGIGVDGQVQGNVLIKGLFDIGSQPIATAGGLQFTCCLPVVPMRLLATLGYKINTSMHMMQAVCNMNLICAH